MLNCSLKSIFTTVNVLDDLWIDISLESGVTISGKNCLLEKALLVWKPEYQFIQSIDGKIKSLVGMCVPIVRKHYNVHKLNVPEELKAKLFEVLQIIRNQISSIKEIVPFSFQIREGFPPSFDQLSLTHRIYVTYNIVIVIKSALLDPSFLFTKGEKKLRKV
jgi:hypothetical protein